MSSKRKFSSLGLERRVKARRQEEQWESEAEMSDSPNEAPTEEHENGRDEEDASSESDEEIEGDANAPKVDFSSISFGALAKAQSSMPASERKRNRTSRTSSNEPEPDSPATGGRYNRLDKTETKKQSAADLQKRSSKHAPQEVTSKKPVSRRREIIADPRRKFRDPRFDPLMGKLDESKVAKSYAFLEEFREQEMAELRANIKKSKNPAQKEGLKRQLMSMESRKKARQAREDEANLLSEHRKKEKQLVAQGKQPFYLKRNEQKKQLLANRYASMSKGQVDRAIERKRKKVASKEKKELISLERAPRRH